MIDIKLVEKTLALLSSAISSGEGHSIFSKKMIELSFQALDKIEERLESNKALFGNWINVKDRLPVIGEYVLVTFEDIDAILIGRLLNNGWSVFFSDGEAEPFLRTITHWLPLRVFPQKIEK